MKAAMTERMRRMLGDPEVREELRKQLLDKNREQIVLHFEGEIVVLELREVSIPARS